MFRDAQQPSRWEVMAEDRRQHGAYDPARLEAKFNLIRRQAINWPKVQEPRSRSKHARTSKDIHRLRRRDDPNNGAQETGSSDTANLVTHDDVVNTIAASSSAGTLPPPPPAPAGSGSATSRFSNINGATDTINGESSPASASPLPDGSSTPSADVAKNDRDTRIPVPQVKDKGTEGAIGIAVGMVVLSAVLVGMALYVWRRKLAHPRKSIGALGSRRARSQSQKLGSFDAFCPRLSRFSSSTLPATKDGETHQEVTFDLMPVPSEKLSLASPATSAALNVVLRDIDGHGRMNAVESQKTLTQTIDSYNFPHSPPTEPSLLFFSQSPSYREERRASRAATHRPMTSPGRLSTLSYASFSTLSSPLSVSPSSTFRDSQRVKNGDFATTPSPSPSRRFSSRKTAHVEMERHGSALIIRDRCSVGHLRRPMSGVSSSRTGLMSVLGRRPKTASVVGEGGNNSTWDKDAIVIDTDDMVSKAGEDELLSLDKSTPATKTECQVSSQTDMPNLSKKNSLRLGTKNDKSCSLCIHSGQHTTPDRRSHMATYDTEAASPCGSFSFEIKDVVVKRNVCPDDVPRNVSIDMLRNDSPLKPNPSSKDHVKSPLGLESGEPDRANALFRKGSSQSKVSEATGPETFVRDLDWDLRELDHI